jgi:hypothetical protein
LIWLSCSICVWSGSCRWIFVFFESLAIFTFKKISSYTMRYKKSVVYR